MIALTAVAYPWLMLYALVRGGWLDLALLLALGVATWAAARHQALADAAVAP